MLIKKSLNLSLQDDQSKYANPFSTEQRWVSTSEMGIIGSYIYCSLERISLFRFILILKKKPKTTKKTLDTVFKKLLCIHFIQINIWMNVISVH